MAKLDDTLGQMRDRWHYTGLERPAFAHEPGREQESVWDYPRPPRLDWDRRRVRVAAHGTSLALSSRAVRMLETGSPPAFYIPPDDVRTTLLEPAGSTTFCEWKGYAEYFSVRVSGALIAECAWCYPDPFPEYEAIAGWFSFYPRKLACYVADEPVRPQPAEYYGGWMTSDVVGPFKGEPGTEDL